MTTLHSLRRSRKLSLSELSTVTGISMRRLAEFEYEQRPLPAPERAALAAFFGLRIEHITGGVSVALPAADGTHLSVQHAYVLAAAAAAATLSLSLRMAAPQLSLPPLPSFSAQQATSQTATATPAPTAETLAPQPPTAQPAAEAVLAVVEATPTPVPDLPRGCPVVPREGRIVVTQGYGQGSNRPIAEAGAIDLAVDGDGNGIAEPGATRGATIVAAHGGVAAVTLGAFPLGNHVTVAGDNGWRSVYSHLQAVHVKTGDVVSAGQPLGVIGNTGKAAGPHLDIQIWHENQNVDPSGLLSCG